MGVEKVRGYIFDINRSLSTINKGLIAREVTMKSSSFLILHGVINIVFAFVLFFIAHLVWPMYCIALNEQYAYFLSQHTSIFLGGISVISLLLRDIAQGEIAQRIFLSLLISNILGITITLYASAKGLFVGFGWSDPIFFTILSILSYFQFKRQSLKVLLF